MTAQEVIELAGHRDVPPWVMKLVADCVTRDRKKFAVITVDLVTRAIDLEREECAKLCDELSDKHTWEGSYAHECAIAIRARGKQ
jgi:hypothetical protein